MPLCRYSPHAFSRTRRSCSRTCPTSSTSTSCSRCSTTSGSASATRAPMPLRCAPTACGRPTSTPTSAGACARRCCWPARCSRGCGEVELPPPGGDFIGRRRIDTHLLAFRAPRRRAARSDRSYKLSAPRPARRRHLPRRGLSVTATENALMAAVTADRPHRHPQRRLRAARPGPRALPRRAWARRSSGIGTNRLIIDGGRPPARRPTSRIGPDYIEVGSFIGLARHHRRAT